MRRSDRARMPALAMMPRAARGRRARRRAGLHGGSGGVHAVRDGWRRGQ